MELNNRSTIRGVHYLKTDIYHTWDSGEGANKYSVNYVVVIKQK